MDHSSQFTAFVQENKPIGHPLLKFMIQDADIAPNAAPYTFDFRSGNEMGAFRIEQDGILRTATRFNHKVKDTYRVQIRVFDNGTPPLYSDAWVLIKVIEESQYPPTITPLEISINSYRDDFPGGKIGRVFAQDQDQYDILSYVLTPTAGVLYEPTNLFNISKVDGTLYALPRLDVGDYRVNVTVSDGKFASFMIVKISVDLVTDDMIKSAVMIRFNQITPEEFILSHRKGFIRSIRSIAGTRLKDIIIISVQPAASETSGGAMQYKRSISKDLDVVFAVRRFSPTENLTGFFSASELRKQVNDHIMEIEEMTKLKVDNVMTTKCKPSYCVHGDCVDKIVLDTDFVEAVATDVTSFVSTRHVIKADCECKVGYGGDKCEHAINECSKNPCTNNRICVPDSSLQGYHCMCPEGFGGPNCAKDISKCTDDTCFKPKNPISFTGKSYAQYRIDKILAKKNLEDQLNLGMKIRTVQPTGCLMFSEGRVDFNILELVNGFVQYRFDLGSGEGLVTVSSMFVSDGQWHDIKLEREGNSARLTVDGNYVEQGSAPGVNGVLNLQNDDIYFGAELRKHFGLIGSPDVQRGYIGCMDDITISKIPIPMHSKRSSSVAVLTKFVNVEHNCESTILSYLGPCGHQPCFNGGTCKDLGAEQFECVCHERFKGQFCQEDLDPCASSPCLYGGKCRSEIGGNYTCDCPAKMTGKRCDFGRYCFLNPCRNGGVCEEGDDGPICMCRGYTGPTCEIDVNECDRLPCGNGATCINEPGSFRCICPDEMTGASCGDPLYSNSITSKLRNVRWEYIIAGAGGIMALISSCVLFITCYVCRRKSNRQHINGKNNDGVKENLVANVPPETYKRSSKMSNIDMAQRGDLQQRPVSYTASSNNDHGYPCPTLLQYNNLYGSAGDELEKLPNEYRKLNKPNPNINSGNTSSDNESLHKQKWNDHIQMQTFTDNRINNGKSYNQFHYFNDFN